MKGIADKVDRYQPQLWVWLVVPLALVSFMLVIYAALIVRPERVLAPYAQEIESLETQIEEIRKDAK